MLTNMRNGFERGQRVTLSHRGRCVTSEATRELTGPSVSIGCGLPSPGQMYDWSLTVLPEPTTLSELELALKAHLRIEKFRHRVSQSLGSNALDPAGLTSARERSPLYRLL